MPPKPKYDINKLRKLINEGMTKKEIMESMKMKNMATYNSVLIRLMETDGKVYKVRRGRPKVNTVSIGKRGNLPISSKLLEGKGFKEGDKFTIKTTKNRITLSLVTK